MRAEETRSNLIFAAVVAFCILPVCCAAAVAGPAASSGLSYISTSSNWSGYAFDTPSGTTVNSVQGSWTVPAVNGSETANGYAAYWVGIDGNNPNLPNNEETVEQIGTDSDVVDGVPSYYAWYEMYPADSHVITSLAVLPGDVMSASVQYASSGANAGEYLLSITDERTHDSYSQYHRVPGEATALDDTAEWIAEAPSEASVLPLSQFGTTTFTGASASLSNGLNGPISAFSSYPSYGPILMTPTPSGLGAAPSPLDSTGSSFSVATTWPGDVNSDGKVDINDLTIVLANFGQSNGMWWATGDMTGDGTVDINDLTLVLSNYGNTLGASATGLAAVPEPSILAILCGAAGLLAAGWARRIRP